MTKAIGEKLIIHANTMTKITITDADLLIIEVNMSIRKQLFMAVF